MSSDKPPVKKMTRLGAQRTTNVAPTQQSYDFPNSYAVPTASYDPYAYAAPDQHNPYGASTLNDPYAAAAASSVSYMAASDPYNPYGSTSFAQPSHASAPQMQPQPNAANFASNFASAFQSPMPQFNPSIINNPIVGQFLQNQVTNFSSDLVNKGRSWFDSFKYLFAVDTAYVIKKLCLLLFPFAQKDWLVKYASTDAVAPRDDLNVPDLYIPSMAFVTYVLLTGYLLGLQSLFTPEKLGIQASFALFWLLFEVFCSIVGLHLIGVKGVLGFFTMLSYCSYKFVFMIACLMAGLIFKSSGYWAVLAYCSVALGYFLVRSLNVAIQAGQAQLGSKPGLYLVMGLSLLQPLLMFFMTRHLVYTPA
jgi:hypothetical protein